MNPLDGKKKGNIGQLEHAVNKMTWFCESLTMCIRTLVQNLKGPRNAPMLSFKNERSPETSIAVLPTVIPLKLYV